MAFQEVSFYSRCFYVRSNIASDNGNCKYILILQKNLSFSRVSSHCWLC